jgi:hypothetical protein
VVLNQRIAGIASHRVVGRGYLLAAFSTLSVGLCAWRGQDLNWDLLNYHFYNPYLLLDARFDSDIHAAGVQSFLNPSVDLPLFAAVRLGIPPPLFYLSLAAFHGLIPFFVYRITESLLSRTTPLRAMVLGVVAACTAAFGAGFQAEVGTTMHDNTVAVFLLASLWLLVVRFDAIPERPRRTVLLGGALAGVAAGMKLAAAPFAVGLLAAALMLPGGARTRTTRGIRFCVAAGIGLVVSGGYWMWLMYSHFGNPVFPFFNAFFQSPFAPAENFSDGRFLPTTALQAVFYPFYWVSIQSLVTEPPFRDIRFAMVFVFLSIFGVHRLLQLITRKTTSGQPLIGKLLLIAVFWLVSYVIWLKLFSIYRYAISLEALSAVIVIGVSAALVTSWPRCLALVLPLCVVACASVRPPAYDRIPWSGSYFGVDGKELEKYAGATVLMWDFPQAYVIPLFPRSSRFVRLTSNWGLDEGTAMWRRVVQAVASTDAPLYLLDAPQNESDRAEQAGMLAGLGVQRRDVTCETYSSYGAGFRVCALTSATKAGPGYPPLQEQVPP